MKGVLRDVEGGCSEIAHGFNFSGKVDGSSIRLMDIYPPNLQGCITPAWLRDLVSKGDTKVLNSLLKSLVTSRRRYSRICSISKAHMCVKRRTKFINAPFASQ